MEHPLLVEHPVVGQVVLEADGGDPAIVEQQGGVVYLGNFVKIPDGRIGREVVRVMKNPALRKRLSREGRRVIDGRGLERYVKIIAGMASTGKPGAMK